MSQKRENVEFPAECGGLEIGVVHRPAEKLCRFCWAFIPLLRKK